MADADFQPAEQAGVREIVSSGIVMRVHYAVVVVPGKKNEDFVSTPTTAAPTTADESIVSFGVFDGHGGSEAARYSAQRLCARVTRESSAKALNGEPPADDCLRRAFEGTNDEVGARAVGVAQRALKVRRPNAQVWGQRTHYSGTTAVCLFVPAPTADGVVNLTCASVGDSEAAALVAPPEVVGEESCSCRAPRSAARPAMTRVSTPHNASSHTEVLPSLFSGHNAPQLSHRTCRAGVTTCAPPPGLRTRAQQARILRAAPDMLSSARAAASLPDALPPPPANGDTTAPLKIAGKMAGSNGAPPPLVPERIFFGRRGRHECLFVEWPNGAKPSMHMTRSIGDRDMTRLVIATPGVRRVAVARGHTARCVLATDGMWNQVSDARVRAILSRGGAARPGSDGGALASARSLANEAHRAHVATGQAASRTFDDITVMVVDVSTHPLNGSEPGSPDRQGSVRAAEPSGGRKVAPVLELKDGIKGMAVIDLDTVPPPNSNPNP